MAGGIYAISKIKKEPAGTGDYLPQEEELFSEFINYDESLTPDMVDKGRRQFNEAVAAIKKTRQMDWAGQWQA